MLKGAFLMGLAGSVVAAPVGAVGASGVLSGNQALRQAAFVKEGLERLHNPQYQYECLGLGGTSLRVGPYGFTRPASTGIPPDGGVPYAPFLAYQYWWDEGGHRHYPFELTGGYGESLEPGDVVGFRHRLDIRTGILTIDLDLRLTSTPRQGRRPAPRFHSRREMFVTPEGVLVVRVTDSGPGARSFALRVEANRHVRLYHNGGIYAREHALWAAHAIERPQGLVMVGARPATCTATLAAALKTAEPALAAKEGRLGSAAPGGTTTLYIAPGSSYETADPAETAWQRAARAREQGYDTLRAETMAWWRAFYARSSVDLPDRDVAIWYARSLYYHGIFFGNTDVPPGCNGTGELFSGAVCPEYDLPFSQFALLYTGRFDEARRVARWFGRILPRAERYAREGLTLHRISVRYRGGALFGPLVGYDGAIPTPPTEGEGVWAYERYPGANIAAMALAYLDWSQDAGYEPTAKRILQGTAQLSGYDQLWSVRQQAYEDINMPNSVQQAAALFGYREAQRRGVELPDWSQPDWGEREARTLLPTAEYGGKKVIVVGSGFEPQKGSGDAPWLNALWWYGVIPPDDPLVRPTYDMICESRTDDYVFNAGWMGVYAAKLRDGEEARRWLGRLLRPDVTLFDDTCLGEIVHDADDFRKTPEMGAHGAVICNVAQMLLDADDATTVTLFPALPLAWQRAGVAFHGFVCRGGVRVSAAWRASGITVELHNPAGRAVSRELRVRLPAGTARLRRAPTGTRLQDGWAVVSVVLSPGQRIARRFVLEAREEAPAGAVRP